MASRSATAESQTSLSGDFMSPEVECHGRDQSQPRNVTLRVTRNTRKILGGPLEVATST